MPEPCDRQKPKQWRDAFRHELGRYRDPEVGLSAIVQTLREATREALDAIPFAAHYDGPRREAEKLRDRLARIAADLEPRPDPSDPDLLMVPDDALARVETAVFSRWPYGRFTYSDETSTPLVSSNGAIVDLVSVYNATCQIAQDFGGALDRTFGAIVGTALVRLDEATEETQEAIAEAADAFIAGAGKVATRGLWGLGGVVAVAAGVFLFLRSSGGGREWDD